MTYSLIAPPQAEPVSLAEFKAHLRIDAGDEDGLLASLIVVAREHLERTTGLALIEQGWRLYLDHWPAAGTLEIARGPVKSIEAVRLFEGDGVEVELALNGHVLDGTARPARLWMPGRPQRDRAINGIEVDFTAGFGATGAEVPDVLKRAMLVHAAHMYEFRGAVPVALQPAAIPQGYGRLIAPFAMRRL